MKLARRKALLDARDEILAMKGAYKDYVYDRWFRQDLSSYDYLSYIRDFEDNTLYKHYSKEILIDWYKKIITDAIEAFDKLTGIWGYSLSNAIFHLSNKELIQRPKVVKLYLNC